MKSLRYVNSLTFQLETTAKILNAITKKFYSEEVKNNISMEEFIVLDTLICYPHIDNNVLAQTLYKEKKGIDKVINHLLKKNLIKKVEPNTNEAAIRHYILTADAIRIYQDVQPQNDKVISILANFISAKELISFTKTLLKIKNILISLNN